MTLRFDNEVCTDLSCENESPGHRYSDHARPERWDREGDQPLPIAGQQNVSEAVKRDLDERIALGIKRYGKPLQTFNGRDALLDAYQEALDLVHYLKQAIMERDARRGDGLCYCVDAGCMLNHCYCNDGQVCAAHKLAAT